MSWKSSKDFILEPVLILVSPRRHKWSRVQRTIVTMKITESCWSPDVPSDSLKPRVIIEQPSAKSPPQGFLSHRLGPSSLFPQNLFFGEIAVSRCVCLLCVWIHYWIHPPVDRSRGLFGHSQQPQPAVTAATATASLPQYWTFFFVSAKLVFVSNWE